MKLRLLILACTAILVPVSFIEAPYPREFVLQHVPTVLSLILLAIITVKFRPTTLSFVCLIIFL